VADDSQDREAGRALKGKRLMRAVEEKEWRIGSREREATAHKSLERERVIDESPKREKWPIKTKKGIRVANYSLEGKLWQVKAKKRKYSP